MNEKRKPAPHYFKHIEGLFAVQLKLLKIRMNFDSRKAEGNYLLNLILDVFA